MDKLNLIKEVLSDQKEEGRLIPLDLTLKNGNLLVRGFQVLDLDEKKREIKGITKLESYTSSREKREPVYCFLKLSEIKDVTCSEKEMVSV